nr:serine/threonine-protein kinase STY13-like [Ipomoea batatas]
MEKSSGDFVRADQIDLKSLDEQLERHLNRAWTMEKNKKKLTQEDSILLSVNHHALTAVAVQINLRFVWCFVFGSANGEEHCW